MADDLPIKVTLDPAPAAAGAKKVVKEIEQIEFATKQTNFSIKDLQAQLKNLEREAEKAAKGVKSIDFKQAAAGANQFFQLLNQNLKLTDSALGQALDSATKFGAAGAQLAGPWGAAAGALVGVTTEIISQIEELERLTNQYKLQALADEQFIYNMKEVKGILDGTAGAVRDISDAMEKLYSDKGRTATFFEEWEKGRQAVVLTQQAAEAAKNELMRLGDIADRKKRGDFVSPAEQLELKDSGYTDAKRQYAIEQYTKATKALELNSKSYGSAIVPILNAEQDRAAKLGKLRAALKDTTLTQREYNAVLAEYNKLIGPGDDSAFDRANFALQQEMAARRKQQIQDITYLPGAQGALDDNFADVRGIDMGAALWRTRGGEYKNNALTNAWFAELQRMQREGAEVTASLSEGFGSIGESIAQMAATGAQSFEQMTASMAASLLGLLATKGFQALGNLFGFGATGAIGSGASAALTGIPGFASGGYIPPGGTGGTDSQLVAIRKSPWESVHINTPSQEAAMMGGGGGGGQTINVHFSDRDMARSLEVMGRPTIIRMVAEAFPQLRSPSGR